mmetsp:Transcript_54509/g.106629  ORF Transcript_54509/g.106629 Transcript_54509/m.106629 type:complete len:258 (-) Transcript_54509:13-786(-)
MLLSSKAEQSSRGLSEVPDRTVILDAGALIRLQRVDRMGSTLCTTAGVMAEIKDEKARAHLQTLPVPIKIREPSEKDVKWARSFARKTGDLPFLSQNDVDLIALTYMLQRETGDVKNLRLAPLEVTLEKSSVPFAWGPSQLEKKLEGPGTSATAPAEATGDSETADAVPSEGEQPRRGPGDAVPPSPPPAEEGGEATGPSGCAQTEPGAEVEEVGKGETDDFSKDEKEGEGEREIVQREGCEEGAETGAVVEEEAGG